MRRLMMAVGTASVLSLLPVSSAAAGPTHSIPGPTPPAGSTLVLDLTYHAINDEDSGLSGYWALDHFAEHVQVWSPGGTTCLSGTSYYGFRTYDGGYHTFAGALSPEAGVPEARDIAGNFNGFVEFTFCATSSTSFAGTLSTKDYGGTAADILLGTYGAGQTGPPNVFCWRSAYFVGFPCDASTEVDSTWAFYYYMGNKLGWTNAASGNLGDIVA